MNIKIKSKISKFLLVIIAYGKHSEIDYEILPDDKTFDNAFWQNTDTEIQLINSELYYLDTLSNNNTAYLKRITANGSKTILNIRYNWYADETHYWVGNFSTLSNDGKNLLFSTPNEIIRYNLKSRKTVSVTVPDITQEYFYVYGFTYYDGNLICDLNESPNYEEDTKQNFGISIPYTGYGFGDVDFDDNINANDLIYIRQGILECNGNENGFDLDINKDGTVSILDIVAIKKIMANTI